MEIVKKEFAAMIGNNYRCDNGIKIELGKNSNASGPEAFGAAKEWPCLRLEIPFVVGQEIRMKAIAQILEKKLRDWNLILPEKDNG
jgi:hypothetical protein